MKTYKSSVSLGLSIPLFLLLFGSLLLSFLDFQWLGLIVILGTNAFVIHLYLTTYYQISESDLTIKSGFILNKKIDIKSVSKISDTNSILSAPALSFDRIEISYNKFDSIIISPKDKQTFIAELKAINPNIIVN